MIPQYYYSSTAHMRNRRQEAKGNIMTFTIPGMKKSIDIPFPDRKLPVCKRCKKIFKTRELCRVRDGHTDIPWNTTYVSITLDQSCFRLDEESGEKRLVDEDNFQFIASSIPGPPEGYCAKANVIGGTKVPICITCKDKNYTRHHCREKQEHHQLPWNTVYVKLTALPVGYGNNGTFPVENDNFRAGSATSKRSRSTSSVSSNERASKKIRSDEDSADTTTVASDENNTQNSDIEDINDIHTSHAMLLVIGKDECKLSWLEVDSTAPSICRISTDYETSNGWDVNEDVENIYSGSMNMNTLYPPQGWRGEFTPSPNLRYNPMMGMTNMGSMMAGYPQYCAPAYTNPGASNDGSSPNSQRTSHLPGISQSYEANHGPNGFMGPGMMNLPVQSNKAMYPCDDMGYQSHLYRQFCDGFGPSGMNGNHMMAMGRNFNDQIMQKPNGVSAGHDLNNRRSSTGSYPQNARQMDKSIPPQQHGMMMYP